ASRARPAGSLCARTWRATGRRPGSGAHPQTWVLPQILFTGRFPWAERAVVPPTAHTLGDAGGAPHGMRVVFDRELLETGFMRITEAARRLGTSARMLRYREDLGLLPRVRDRPGRMIQRGPAHRQ